MTKEFARLGGQFTFSKVGKQRKRTYTEKHTKHKNIQQGLVTVYCYNISAYMKVKDKRCKGNNSSRNLRMESSEGQ